jgi:hypothetical protein
MESSQNDGRRRLPEPDTEQRLEHLLVSHADAPDELTLYPADVAEDEITTTWITAQEGAYVSLREWR